MVFIIKACIYTSVPLEAQAHTCCRTIWVGALTSVYFNKDFRVAKADTFAQLIKLMYFVLFIVLNIFFLKLTLSLVLLICETRIFMSSYCQVHGSNTVMLYIIHFLFDKCKSSHVSSLSLPESIICVVHPHHWHVITPLIILNYFSVWSHVVGPVSSKRPVKPRDTALRGVRVEKKQVNSVSRLLCQRVGSLYFHN